MDSGYCETDRYVTSLSLMGKYFAKILKKILKTFGVENCLME